MRQTLGMQSAPDIACEACEASNPPDFRFCGSCGAALGQPCPSCASRMPPATRFCGACGADMATQATAGRPSEERKVVTVLFADLADSTELATRLDPEDLRAVYASYYGAMARVIESHGGVVEKFIGDAVVGVFGAPVTHEDDPERAVRAARGMHEALADVNRSLDLDLEQELVLRVGVHTGEVIASPGTPAEALVTGDAISIAARLQGVAPSGGVVVSERTYRDTVRSFAFDALGAFDLKGVPDPTDVWLVTGESAPELPSSDRPLVGRGEELALLDVLLRRCEREGASHLVTIVGPAGVGKSRLAFEFMNSTHATTVRGRCLPYGTGLRLWALAEIVKTEASILDSDPHDVIVAKAGSRIARRFHPDDASGASLSVLLSSIGIPVDPDPLAGLGPAAGERMIVNTWARYFTTLAADRPVVAWIEDVHWADDALLDLLERLVARVEAPILFLSLARPELFERRPTWGATAGSTSTLALRSLSAQETATLIEHLLDPHGNPSVDPELLSAVIERTGGNPFFATEVIRMLKEQGSIARLDGTWSATRDVASTMPDTVQAAIAARIDRLDTSVKAVLQLASVMGHTFWIGTTDELSGPGVDAAVEVLVDRGLVRHRRSSSIAGARECAFEHALIREVAYGSLPKTRRATGHRQVLEWMAGATRGRDEEFAELIAYHAEAAGDPVRTARYATLAGHRHRRVYAAEDAIRWYQRATDAADRLPVESASGLRAEIHHSRAEASEQLGRYEDALEDYREALAIARTSGRTWLMAQELAAIAGALRSLQRYEDAESVIPEALQTARDAGWEYVEAHTLSLAGQLAWDRGDPSRARGQLEEGLRIAQQALDLEGEAFARTGLAEIGLCQGPFDRAIADGARARQLWLRLGHRPAAAAVAQKLGLLRLLTGDAEAAEDLLRGALDTAQELGIARDQPRALTGLALIATMRGELGEAVSRLADAIDLATASGATRSAIEALLWRVSLWQTVNARERAGEDLETLATLAPDAVGYLEAVRVTAEGWLAALEGSPKHGRDAFGQGRKLAHGLQLSRIWCGRMEIDAWYRVGDQGSMADAATWMVSGADGCPAAEALGTWALARTGTPSPASALEVARSAGDRTLLWRACVLAANDATERGDTASAERLRNEARDVVGSLADSLGPDEELRENFLSSPEVAALLDGTPR